MISGQFYFFISFFFHLKFNCIFYFYSVLDLKIWCLTSVVNMRSSEVSFSIFARAGYDLLIKV